uniref:SH3 and cysteine-rich domain-containing protein 3-like isoform X1 n=1 Tax=Styela clava TaxID=7725 RepID=UPI0019392E3E|nr:SH3 and cysteine-rich domain-containing protein 3-like isoform X1 [Styela clava]
MLTDEELSPKRDQAKSRRQRFAKSFSSFPDRRNDISSASFVNENTPSLFLRNHVQRESITTLTALAAPKVIGGEIRRAFSLYGSNPTSSRSLKALEMFSHRQTVDDAPEIQHQHNGHLFVKQTFKKATFCDVCQRLLLESSEGQSPPDPSVGTVDYQRQGFRCKICKLNIHENCSTNMEMCTGKPFGVLGFNRHSSVNQELPRDDTSVDSVYQILKQGKVLRMGEGSDVSGRCTPDSLSPRPSTSSESITRVKSPVENRLTKKLSPKGSPSSKRKTEKSTSDGYNYVVLFKYEPREKDDLELRVGDRIRVIKDKDETWWLGECLNKIGYFPAKFVGRIRPNEVPYIANKIIYTTDSSGRDITIKRNQVVLFNPEWPMKKENSLYCRVGVKEIYIPSKDISPL